MPAPKQTKVKFPRAKATKIIKKVEKHLKPFVDRQMACGSYRRGAQMIGDIDFVVIPKEGVTLPQMLPPNEGINWVGDNKAQVVIDGEKVDFKVTTPEAWGATILYFTGPADFNIKYRWMAKKRGMKLNEYGLFDRNTDAYIAGATEQDIYDALKRPFRDPDQRKGWKAETFGSDSCQKCGALLNYGYWINECCDTPFCSNCGDDCYAATNDMRQPINEEHVLNCTEHSCCMDYTSRGLHITTKAKNWPLIQDFWKSGGYDIGRRHNFVDSINDMPPKQIKILNSWEEWENINQGFDGPDGEWFQTKGKSGNNRGFHEWYYINFPCTVYRGSEKRGIDYETYLGMDDNAIMAQLPKSMTPRDIDHAAALNQGVRNVIAVAPEMTEALNYGNFSLEPKSSRESHAYRPFEDNETTGSELYSFDIQDYLVTFPRLSNVGRSGRALPVIFIAGGVYYDDAILLWEQDYYSKEAETFGSENQWIVDNLTMLLTQRARTLSELIDDLGIRGITVESNLVRLPNFVRVGKHVPAVWGLAGQDYNRKHPYNAISPAAGRKQHLKTMFEKLDPRELDWDDDVTWNQKNEPDWSDEVSWDAEGSTPRCPICFGFIPNNANPGAYPGALSRYDNATEICSACGQAEGMSGLFLGSVDKDKIADMETITDPWLRHTYLINLVKDIMPAAFRGE